MLPAVETISYASSADGTAGLVADLCMVPDGNLKPLLLVMHGYRGSKGDVTPDLRDLAARGIVAVAPDMRGRGRSPGVWDSGGKDVHDILDAAVAAIKRSPREIDSRNINIVGFSGGGANAIACAVRFPDLFQTCVSFFGFGDYAAQYHSSTVPKIREAMASALGGSPEVAPDAYAARNTIAAAGNAMRTRLHFLWDEMETLCAPASTEAFLDAYWRAGGSRATAHVSRKGDVQRWIHGYARENPDLRIAYELFLPDILAPKLASPDLADHGQLVVIGYLVTHRFTVWIGRPQDRRLREAQEGTVMGRVTLQYDLRGTKPEYRIIENHQGYSVFFGPSPLARIT